MTDTIYLAHESGGFVVMHRQDYELEEHLESDLSKCPDLLGQLLVVRRQAPVPDAEGSSGRWFLDLLCLDREAKPTLVEVKRCTNTQIRREVVAQMLDYAANATRYWPARDIQRMFEETCSAGGVDAQERLLGFLDGRYGDEEPLARFWETVDTNLIAGRVRMILVADRIPPELCRIVEFLNKQLRQSEIIAIDVAQYVGEERRALASATIGRTQEATDAKTASPRPTASWDDAAFLERLESDGDGGTVDVGIELYEWAKRQFPTHEYGSSAGFGNVMFRYVTHGATYTPLSFSTSGAVSVPFQHLRKKPPFGDPSSRLQYLEQLNRALSEKWDDSVIDGWPWRSAETLDLALFRAAADWFVRFVDEYWAKQDAQGL